MAAIFRLSGLQRDRLMLRGMGSLMPRAANDSQKGRALNRRVEMVLTPQDTMLALLSKYSQPTPSPAELVAVQDAKAPAKVAAKPSAKTPTKKAAAAKKTVAKKNTAVKKAAASKPAAANGQESASGEGCCCRQYREDQLIVKERCYDPDPGRYAP